MKYQKLSKQPLSIVLAEFRFSPVLAMEKYISEIQDALRENYPKYKPRKGHRIEITNGEPKISDAVYGWDFASEDSARSVRIDQNRIIVSETKYNRFPGFLENCERALALINKIVKLNILERVGLRYTDTIVPEEGRTLNDYLAEELFPGPIAQKISSNITLHKVETRSQSKVGRLTIQVLMGNHGLPVLPDIIDHYREHTWKQIPEGVITAILDIDHIWEPEEDQKKSFDVGIATEKLDELHEIARQAFWETTTLEAKMEYWK